MAGEFDFEPESDDVLNGIADAGKPMGSYVHVCRELRAWRDVCRAVVEAGDKGDLSRILPAEAKLRALVAHVGGGE